MTAALRLLVAAALAPASCVLLCGDVKGNPATPPNQQRTGELALCAAV